MSIEGEPIKESCAVVPKKNWKKRSEQHDDVTAESLSILIKIRNQRRALQSFPEATRSLQSSFHLRRLDFIFLSPSVLPIQRSSESSSSGTKKEERRERMVSKLAELEVMWSITKR